MNNKLINNKNAYNTAHKLYRNAINEISTDPQTAKEDLSKVLTYLKKFLNPNYINGKIGRKIKASYSDVVVEIGNAYNLMKKGDKAVKFYKNVLADHKDYVNDWGLGAIYNNIGAYTPNSTETAMEHWYLKACKYDKNNLTAHNNLKNMYRDKITKDTKKTDLIRLKYLKQLIYINNIKLRLNKRNKTVCNIDSIKDSIDILQNFENQKEWIATNLNSNINPLIYESSSNQNNFDEFKDNSAIINLLELVKYSLCFLNNHFRSILLKPDTYHLYQYTSINTLKSICNINKLDDGKPLKFHLRLYNSDYMNDPLEGKGLLNQLIHIKDNDKKVKKLINVIYHNDNSYNGTDKNVSKRLTTLHASRVYIASLSDVNPGDNDSMSLWNSYSNNHKGIALGLDVNIHQSKEKLNDKNINSSSSVNQKFSHINKIPLNLYKISYDTDDFDNPNVLKKLKFYKTFYNEHIDDSDVKKHKDFRKQMKDKLNDVSMRIDDINDLNTLFDIINSVDLKILNDPHIFNLIKLSLDRIRFLSKSGVYKYENEYRIMEEIPPHTYKNKDVLYDSGNEKLYVNLGNNDSEKNKDNVTANLTQIVFGNRCKSYYWVPIVEKQLPHVKVQKSDIKYR